MVSEERKTVDDIVFLLIPKSSEKVQKIYVIKGKSVRRIEVDERKKNKTVYFNFIAWSVLFGNECSGGRCIYGVSCR